MNFQDPDTITGTVAPEPLDRHLAMYAAQTDRIVNSLSAALAQIAAKNPQEAAEKFMDPSFRLGVAAANRVLTGYNPADLMRGISGGLSGAMPSFNIPVGGPGAGIEARTVSGTSIGRGSLSDVFAQNVFKHVQDTYFNQLGLAKMSKTYGMSKTQMGDVFQVMGQRGMLSGVSAGNVELNQETGVFDLKTSKATFDRIDEQFKKTSQVLGVVKKMFGASGSISELANIAEKATGLTMGPNNIGAVLNRLQNIETLASSAGVNKTVASQIISASALNVSQFGTSMSGALATGAAKTTGTAFRGIQAASALAAQRGSYIAPRDLQEFQQAETAMRGQLLEENPLLAESMFVLQNVKTLSPEKAAEIQASILKFQKAGTRSEQGAANAAMRAAIESATGTQAGVLTEKMGGIRGILKNLRPETQQQISDIAGENLQNRGVNVLSDLISSTQMLNQAFGAEGTFTNEEGGQAGMALMAGLNAQSRNELSKILKTGDKEKALKFLDEKKSMLENAGLGSGAKILEQMIKQDVTGSRQFMDQIEVMSSGMENMITTTSAEDRKAQEHFNARKRVSNIFDTALINQPGTIQDVIKNTLGISDVGNEEKMRYLVASGGGYKQFSMTNIGQTQEEAKNLAEVLNSYDVNLFEQYKVKQDDYEGLSKAIGADKDRLFSILADKGVVGAQMPKGKVGLAFKESAERATKKLDLAQQAKQELILEGVDSSAPDFDAKLQQKMLIIGAEDPNKATPEDVFKKQASITKKFSQQYIRDDVLKDALNNPNSQRFKDLVELQKANPDLLDPMFKAAQKKIQSSDMSKEDKDRKLQQLNDLQERLKEAKGNNMIGIVEIRGDKTFMKQYKK